MLTDRDCESACDAFAAAVKDLHLGTLIGTRTAGIASGPANGWLLDDGSVLGLPAEHVLGADHEIIDGTGVAPGLYLAYTARDLASGHDLTSPGPSPCSAADPPVPGGHGRPIRFTSASPQLRISRGQEYLMHQGTSIGGGRKGPSGLAVNSRYIYWANWGNDVIGRARLNGTDISQRFVTVLGGSLRGVAVHSGR